MFVSRVDPYYDITGIPAFRGILQYFRLKIAVIVDSSYGREVARS